MSILEDMVDALNEDYKKRPRIRYLILAEAGAYQKVCQDMDDRGVRFGPHWPRGIDSGTFINIPSQAVQVVMVPRKGDRWAVIEDFA